MSVLTQVSTEALENLRHRFSNLSQENLRLTATNVSLSNTAAFDSGRIERLRADNKRLRSENRILRDLIKEYGLEAKLTDV